MKIEELFVKDDLFSEVKEQKETASGAVNGKTPVAVTQKKHSRRQVASAPITKRKPGSSGKLEAGAVFDKKGDFSQVCDPSCV